MSKKIMICAVFVFFALSTNVALSEMVYPPELNEVSAPYPGAAIAQTTKAGGTVMVAMESNDNLATIYEFYKTELAANGWKISAEMQSPEVSGLMGAKGSNTVRINIAKNQSGKSMIMLMLSPNQ
jgi:hypothetical protein